MPKKVSRMANMEAMLLGNSLAIMEKLPVRKPELPHASMILRAKDNPKKTLPFSILSSNPKRIEVTPTVPMPMLSVAFKGEGEEKTI